MIIINYGFIGAGNIAGAIIGGILQSGYINPENIYVNDISAEKAMTLAEGGVVYCSSATELVKKCDFIFLTVKPQVYPTVLSEIRQVVSPSTCLISVAAGKKINYVKEVIGFDCKVIRVMPNTPLMSMCGASALVKAESVSDEEFNRVRGIFDSCGATCVVDEAKMDAVTGVSGSGPAFVFRFIKNMIEAGIDSGLDYYVAKKLAVQTAIGSATMLSESELSIDELVTMVTSPGGTTEAGLKSMDESGFDNSVKGAVIAAVKRSIFLSE